MTTMTVRPVGARVVAYVAGGCLIAMFAVIAVALSPEVRSGFTPSQVGTLVLMLAVVLAVLWGIARSTVRTDESGIHIRNGYRSHHVPWADARTVSFGGGTPWGVLETVDGASIAMIAIQGSDGQYARTAVQLLRTEIVARH